MTIGEALRAARNAAGISLCVMATRTHYSKPYLSMVETGQRAATTDVVRAYERVLGIGQLGDEVNRRNFFRVARLVAANTTVATGSRPASQATTLAHWPWSRPRTAPIW